MFAEKLPLTLGQIETQSALELPEREVPATVIVGCLAVCVGKIVIRDIDIDVAATVCAAVQALSVSAGDQTIQFSCTTRGA